MTWDRKHLLDIESLSAGEINLLLDTARAFKAVGGNTSAHDGSKSNGGQVALNTRPVRGTFPASYFVRVGA